MEESHFDVLHELPCELATELFLNIAGWIESQELLDLLKLQSDYPLEKLDLDVGDWKSMDPSAELQVLHKLVNRDIQIKILQEHLFMKQL